MTEPPYELIVENAEVILLLDLGTSQLPMNEEQARALARELNDAADRIHYHPKRK